MFAQAASQQVRQMACLAGYLIGGLDDLQALWLRVPDARVSKQPRLGLGIWSRSHISTTFADASMQDGTICTLVA